MEPETKSPLSECRFDQSHGSKRNFGGVIFLQMATTGGTQVLTRHKFVAAASVSDICQGFLQTVYIMLGVVWCTKLMANNVSHQPHS